MFNKKKISAITLTIVLSLSSTLVTFADENTSSNSQEIAINSNNEENKNLEGLSIQQLTETREKCISKNLEKLSEFGEGEIQNIKDGILNSDFGLIAFINNNYKELTEKDKLIKQIELIEYLNSINQTMDPVGDFFNVVNEDYQLSEYLLQKGKDSDTTSYENLKFIINNLEDTSKFIDYDVKNLIENVDPLIKPSLSKEQKSSLNDNLKEIASDDSLNSEIKNEIKELQEVQNQVDQNAGTLRSMNTLRSANSSSYNRQNALNYARKHGYTNGYYGSTNEKNNAPSPYYNFKKDNYGDCANFVSQCLRAGGISFLKGNNPWYYYSTSNRSESWAGARAFKLHWMKRVDYTTMTVSNSLSFLKSATPISICYQNGIAYHTVISTDKHSNGYNFSYAAHTDYMKRTNLLDKLKDKLITYYNIY